MATAVSCSRISDTAGKTSPLEHEQEPKPNRTLQSPNHCFNAHQTHTHQAKASSLNETKSFPHYLEAPPGFYQRILGEKKSDRKGISNSFVTVIHPTCVMQDAKAFPRHCKPLVSPYLALGGMAVFQHVMPVPKQNPLERQMAQGAEEAT